jgi:uncharacterized protein with PIN domain
LKLPKFTPEDVARIAREIPKHMAERRADEEDKRRRVGKYAPETAPCRVCGGRVSGVVRYRHSDRIGGPPPPSYVAHWECEGCGLMYGRCPK